MCVLSYKYKESTHFDFCLVKRVQRITVLKVYDCHPLDCSPKVLWFEIKFSSLNLIWYTPDPDPDPNPNHHSNPKPYPNTDSKPNPNFVSLAYRTFFEFGQENGKIVLRFKKLSDYREVPKFFVRYFKQSKIYSFHWKPLQNWSCDSKDIGNLMHLQKKKQY